MKIVDIKKNHVFLRPDKNAVNTPN